MSDFDFNNAQAGGGAYDIIPNGTVARMIMTIRPGGAGDGGWLKASKGGDAFMLDCEFAVLEGPFRNRKFWGNMVVSGGKVDESGNSIAGNITRAGLRAILESARGIAANDESDEAKKKRIVSGYADFNGLEFVGKIGIEKGNGNYADRNTLIGAMPADARTSTAAPASSAAKFNAPAPATARSSDSVPVWAQ